VTGGGGGFISGVKGLIVNLESGVTKIYVLYSAYNNKFKFVILVPSNLCAERIVQPRCTYQSVHK